MVSNEEAIRHYQQTGEHLGIFRTPEAATAYAKSLHEQQANEYRPRPGGRTIERNNNPGALRVPGSTQFQQFRSPQEGISAQESLLGRYHQRGLRDVSSIVETYAPRRSRGGDNTDEQVNNYINYVSRRLGVNPRDALSPTLIPRLGQVMREFETGNRSF